jgi:hypothetical protein
MQSTHGSLTSNSHHPLGEHAAACARGGGMGSSFLNVSAHARNVSVDLIKSKLFQKENHSMAVQKPRRGRARESQASTEHCQRQP